MRERLEEPQVSFELTQAAKEENVREGYDPAYGARPLRRVVQRRIENEYRFAEVASQGAAEPVSVAA